MRSQPWGMSTLLGGFREPMCMCVPCVLCVSLATLPAEDKDKHEGGGKQKPQRAAGRERVERHWVLTGNPGEPTAPGKPGGPWGEKQAGHISQT